MKYQTSISTLDGIRAVITRNGESRPLYSTDIQPDKKSALLAADRWLNWYVNVPNGTVDSIYYILEVPETWPGPHPQAHPYSGLRMKIGLTRDVRKRLSNLKTGSSAKLIIHALEPGDRKVEAARHEQFSAERRQGEWFTCSSALATHVMKTWYRNNALPPEHQLEVMALFERLRILRAVREMNGGRAPDMINPSLNEDWHGFVFIDLAYAHPVDE